jgi:hypothetical protein
MEKYQTQISAKRRKMICIRKFNNFLFFFRLFYYFFFFLSRLFFNASEFLFALCLLFTIFFFIYIFLSGFLRVDVKKNITTSSTEQALATVSFFSLSLSLDKNLSRGIFMNQIWAFFNAANVRTAAATNQKCRM